MESSPKLISSTGIVVDLVIAVAFYAFMLGFVRTHVPLEPVDYPMASPIIAYATTACLTGVFWLALCCFRITLTDHRLRRKEQCKSSTCTH